MRLRNNSAVLLSLRGTFQVRWILSRIFSPLAVLNGWLAEGSFEGFVVTPFRATSLNSALTRASHKNIPIINIDELIPEEAAKADDIKIIARIASNNEDAGKLDAQLVLNSVPRDSDVAVIEGDPGTTSSMDRVRGFANAAKEEDLTSLQVNPQTGIARRPMNSRRLF